MKKIFSYLPVTAALLICAFCVSACGGDDSDDKNSSSGNNNETPAGNLPPSGYYMAVYDQPIWGEDAVNMCQLEYTIQSHMWSALQRGNTNAAILSVRNVANGDVTDYMGFYLFNQKYVVDLFCNATLSPTDMTFKQHVYNFGGTIVTAYFNITSIDNDTFGKLDDMKGYTYSNGVISQGDRKYVLQSLTNKIDWVEAECQEYMQRNP
ncbi:MAG: hypothetical protein K5928_08400 [Prevotella sp.]|nr:hypothetical protein [Prevotella sp.]